MDGLILGLGILLGISISILVGCIFYMGYLEGKKISVKAEIKGK